MKTCMKPSRLIGPEDIRPGIFVAISHETFQFIPDRESGMEGRHIKPARVTVIPCNAGQPLLVKNVCLPIRSCERSERQLLFIGSAVLSSCASFERLWQGGIQAYARGSQVIRMSRPIGPIPNAIESSYKLRTTEHSYSP